MRHLTTTLGSKLKQEDKEVILLLGLVLGVGYGVDLGATTCNREWNPLYCCEDAARLITDFTQ